MSFQHRPLNGTDRLPAELIAQILDDIKDDTQTLHACSLVCASWHSYLIDSLYETIHLVSRSQLGRLVSAVRRYPVVRHRIASARELILSSYSELASGFVDLFPLVLGPHLRKVEHLCFRDCMLWPLHRSFFGMLCQLKGVKRLELSTSSPRNFADFQRIVCAFPQLEELDITGLEGFSRTPSQPTPPHLLNLPCVPKLSSIRIDDVLPDFFHDLIAWLSSSGGCSTIRRLNIFPYPEYDCGLEPMNVLLTHTASTLEHLSMLIVVDILDDHWGFPQFLHLRVLDITLACRTFSVWPKGVHQRLRSILASLTSPALERVRLLLQLPSSMPPSRHDMDATALADRAQYADLHAVLARPIFSSLQRVTVVLYGADPSRKGLMAAKDVALRLLDFLRALFAPWCVRGIVNLVSAASASNLSLDVVLDKGEGLHYMKLSGSDYGWEELLADLGF